MWIHSTSAVVLVARLALLAPLAPPVAHREVETPRQADLAFLLDTIRATHPDPYAHRSREEWERAVEATRARAEGSSEARFFLDLTRLVAMLGDGHSALIPAPETLGARSYGIDFEFFDDGLFVVAADPLYREAVGKRVAGFGEQTIAEVLVQARPWVSADNEQGARATLELVLAFPCFHEALGLSKGPAPYSLSVEDEEGVVSAIRLREPDPGSPHFLLGRPAEWVAIEPDPPPLWRRKPEAPYWFEALEDERAVYLRWARVEHAESERFPAFCERLFRYVEEHEIERLVVDLRGNRGGNNYITQSLIHGVIKSRVDHPGGVYVLTDHRTFSAAMNCASYLERDTWALFAGAPTGASPNHFGDAEEFRLPNSGHLLLCSSVRWQDSDPKDERPWIHPDVPVLATFEDFRAGEDAVLDAVLRHQPSAIEGYTGVLPRAHWQRATQTPTTWPP